MEDDIKKKTKRRVLEATCIDTKVKGDESEKILPRGLFLEIFADRCTNIFEFLF